MLRKKTRPMDPKETETMFMLLMSEISGKSVIEGMEDKAPVSYQILSKRLEFHGVRDLVSSDLVLWCTMLSDSPGKCVMWAWFLAHMAKSIYKGKVTISQWADEFPMGVPTEECYEECWDRQKEGGANKLDMAENWPGGKSYGEFISLMIK